MDVPDHIDGNVVLYLDIYEAFLLREMIVCSEYDLPCVPSRKRLPVFEPLDHRSNEFNGDPVFAIVRRLKLRALVSFLHLAGTLIRGVRSRQENERTRQRGRTFGDDLQASVHGALLFFHLDRLLKLDLAHELLRRLELLADLRVLRLESEHPLHIGDGRLRLEDLYVTHRTTCAQGQPAIPKRRMSTGKARAR